MAGAPASGQKTQAMKLGEDYDFEVIIVGNLLINEVKSNGPLCDVVKDDVEKGEIANSDATVKLIRREILR